MQTYVHLSNVFRQNPKSEWFCFRMYSQYDSMDLKQLTKITVMHILARQIQFHTWQARRQVTNKLEHSNTGCIKKKVIELCSALARSL